MNDVTLASYERLLVNDVWMSKYQAEYIKHLVNVAFSAGNGTGDTHNVNRKAVRT